MADVSPLHTDPSSLRIVFAGTPDFAASALEALINKGYNIIAAYTQPDRPAGRGKKLHKSPVKQLAEQHKIPVYQPLNFKDTSDQQALKLLDADLMIVAAYGIILPKVILDTPKRGCINIHASLLPRWRGAAPIQRAIQAGDNETGITIMQMDEGLDTGNMLWVKKTPITKEDTGGTLHDRLADLGADAVIETLERLDTPELSNEQQDDQLACYAHKLSKADAEINWHQPAEIIQLTIRAFNPWPVAYTIEAGERIRVFEADIIESSTDKSPGTIINKSRDGVVVACGQGALNITKLQLPGAKAMSVSDFVNGGKAMLEIDTILTSAEANS
ncbi:methionyl-tRNA formyltransferase [Alkalimarinus sediminis]|uniref:Methionyl-tRNA formyltransferase n=1 Tax=Alkalimarinus sediminis TaxID=1632866 RepID=A0A9E8HI16_9ALTE|nr:methionyl-tRNA formyltransferase [Alkalimarinus sediminis]UZW75045.1 methionyl-tRNA formyltransferase [Alkalimarinus sediminis]